MLSLRTIAALSLTVTLVASAQLKPSQHERGRAAVHARAGCYLVDYSFVETDSLKDGYARDNQVYDVNRDKSIKEWIVADDLSPTHIRLQHVLTATHLSGQQMRGATLRHTGEDWIFNPAFQYDFKGDATWEPRPITTQNLWERRVVSLDDGPRYDCAAPWREDREYADWSCKGDAPIPGRETRDMHRHDYQMLDRDSHIIVYDNNWLEREANTKIIFASGTKTPLVKELGKTWYVRLPDNECSEAKAFIEPRMAFWHIVGQEWEKVLDGKSTFAEITPGKDDPSRYEKMEDLEEKYLKENLNDPKKAAEARAEIAKVIREYRKP
jgi:hypothetical protein